MNLQEMLSLSSLSGNKKIGISEERIQAIIPAAREYIAFWREYPDLFIDFLLTGGKEDVETTFKFYTYQRLFLRAAMRHRKVFACFPRGWQKSCPFLFNCGNSEQENPQPSTRRFNDYPEIADQE